MISEADIVAPRIVSEAGFTGTGLMPPPLSSCDSVAVITSLVTAGAGISILPVCVVEAQLAAGVLRRLEVAPKPPLQRIVVAWLPGAESRGIPNIVPAIRRIAGATRFLV
jgi:DNA-binding transcriptional LysR family regulator